MSGKKKIFVTFVFGLFFSAIALYFSFKNIPFGEIVQYLGTINYWWAIPSVLANFMAFAVRAIRWRFILEPVKKTGFWEAFHPMMIGFSLNCILPARIGEVARPIVFAKRENVSFFSVLATVGAERVFDLLILLIFFVALFATVDIAPDLERSFGTYRLNKATLEKIGATTAYVAFTFIIVIVLICLRSSRRVISRIIMAVPGFFFFTGPHVRARIKDKISAPLARILENFASGFDLLKNPKKLFQCFFLSFLVWSFSALSYYVLSFGSPGINVSFLEMSASMVIVCFFISLPSVPGFWGLWEAGGIFALLVFGVSKQEAAGFTLANHAVQIVPVIIVGLISSVITGVDFLNVAYGNSIEPEDLHK